MCRCIIFIEAAKHMLLLTSDTSENDLKDRVVVPIALVRT